MQPTITKRTSIDAKSQRQRQRQTANRTAAKSRSLMKLTQGQARVLLFLFENASDDGECYRYVKQIAEAVELSQIYVRQVTRQLAKLGMIAYEWMWELD